MALPLFSKLAAYGFSLSGLCSRTHLHHGLYLLPRLVVILVMITMHL